MKLDRFDNLYNASTLPHHEYDEVTFAQYRAVFGIGVHTYRSVFGDVQFKQNDSYFGKRILQNDAEGSFKYYLCKRHKD